MRPPCVLRCLYPPLRVLRFLSVRPDAPAEGLPHMWHGGCAVAAGEKWTMQVFKELPRVRELPAWG